MASLLTWLRHSLPCTRIVPHPLLALLQLRCPVDRCWAGKTELTYAASSGIVCLQRVVLGRVGPASAWMAPSRPPARNERMPCRAPFRPDRETHMERSKAVSSAHRGCQWHRLAAVALSVLLALLPQVGIVEQGRSAFERVARGPHVRVFCASHRDTACRAQDTQTSEARSLVSCAHMHASRGFLGAVRGAVRVRGAVQAVMPLYLPLSTADPPARLPFPHTSAPASPHCSRPSPLAASGRGARAVALFAGVPALPSRATSMPRFLLRTGW